MDLAIPFLGKYLEKTLIQKDKCTSMFTAARFTRAKTQKQLKCPMTDEWIKIMIYIYTQRVRHDCATEHTHTHTDIHTHNGIIQKNEMMSFAAIRMNLSY